MLLLAFLACTPDPSDEKDSGQTGTADSQTTETGDSGTTDTTDTETEDPAVEAEDITAELATVQTVIRVRWTTSTPSTGYVRFSEDESYAHETNRTELATEHEVLLIGIPAETDIHFQVVTEGEAGGTATSTDQVFTTGSLPPELPVLTATGTVTSWVGQYLILPLQGTTLGVVIVDDQGRIVWYDLVDPGVNLMRSVFSADGRSVVHMLAGPQDLLETGSLLRVDMAGEVRTPMLWPYIDHDFCELPDGTFAAIVVAGDDERDGIADTLVEMAPDGTQTLIYNAWDDGGLAPFYSPEIGNWTHGNGLDYDPTEDVYYLSMKQLGTIVKIDRATGAPIWHLNGVANEFTFPEGTEIVAMQHQFQKLPGGMLVFDNGDLSRGYSQAVEMTLDETNLTAEQTWTYGHTPPLGVYAKGDVERYADGNTRVVWSSSGEIQDVDPEGNVIWQLNTELGYAITFVQRVESLYGG